MLKGISSGSQNVSFTGHRKRLLIKQLCLCPKDPIKARTYKGCEAETFIPSRLHTQFLGRMGASTFCMFLEFRQIKG